MTTSYVVLSDDEDGVAVPPPPPVLPPIQKSSQPEIIELLTDTDEDIPSTGMAMTSATATFRQTSTTSVSNNLTSFKPASRKSSMLPPEEEIIVVDSDGEDSEDMKDSTDVKDLFNLVQDFVTKPIASSPVKVASQKNDDTLNDSIVDSSFHFSVDGVLPQRRPAASPSYSQPTPVPDNVRWLSSEDEDEGPVILSSQPAPSTTILAQPVKRSKSTQNPPDDKPAKRAKRSKTTDIITHLPKIDDYQYTQQDLKNANRVTRKKEEIYEEMKLHVSSAVYSLFANDMTNFKMELVQTDYELPIMFWKRNITAMYDKERDIFIPCHQQKLMEKTLVMYYLGPEFLRKLKTGEIKDDVKSALRQVLEITANEYHVIIMVEGYDKQLNKIKAFEQRKFRSQVLHGLDTQEQSRSRNTEAEMSQYPSSSEAELLVNKAQIQLGVNIFTTRGRPESVMWLNSFTNMIGESRYSKFERNPTVANLGTVKSGDDARGTFLQSMQQFKLITKSSAEKLYVSYKSMHSLYAAMKTKGTLGKDPMNRNIVPPSVDKTMFKLFTADDPNSVIN